LGGMKHKFIFKRGLRYLQNISSIYSLTNHCKKEYGERSFSFSATSTKLLISLVTLVSSTIRPV
ncbi:MAG: hypothetical protein WAL53_00235, partial [Nitrososphaeraceae archaeon]